MFIRQIHYLLALAKTGHFGRAAEACHVSQPALSTAIQHLEKELGVSIVKRGKRFQGLTDEGERLLKWAQQLADNWEGMRQEASQSQGDLTGLLRLGSIPTTLAVTPLITEPFQTRYPRVRIQLVSRSSEKLIQQLEEFQLDAAITYLDDAPQKGFSRLPLYQERHVLLARNPEPELVERPKVTWEEIARLPLCLLTPNMHNRQMIDSAFKTASVEPNVMLETDSVFSLYSHVRCAGLYSVVPHSMMTLFEMRQEVSAIPIEPELSRSVGMIVRNSDTTQPIVNAAWDVASELDFQGRFDRLIGATY